MCGNNAVASLSLHIQNHAVGEQECLPEAVGAAAASLTLVILWYRFRDLLSCVPSDPGHIQLGIALTALSMQCFRTRSLRCGGRSGVAFDKIGMMQAAKHELLH